MPNFLMVYHGGSTPTSQDEIDQVMAEWGTWFESIGQDVVDPGNPVGQSYTVSADGVVDNGGANPVSGYSIIKATDQDAANEIASRNPMVTTKTGNVEVVQIFEM